MAAAHQIRYARAGGVNLAYDSWGEGDEVVLYTPPLVSNVELVWELPELERPQTRIGRYLQAISFDKRGVGLSDRVDGGGGLEERVADAVAVLDAVGVDRAHIAGVSEGGIVGMAVAAMAPDRVKSLLLLGAPAAGVPLADLASYATESSPMPNEAHSAERYRAMVRTWGTPESIFPSWFAPSAADDERVRAWMTRFERQSASPGSLRDYLRKLATLDLRPLVSKIAAPTLLQHLSADDVVPVANARWLASHLPRARLIEYDGVDHWWPFSPSWRAMQDDQIEHLTGRRAVRDSESRFAVVLFTDLVDSTRTAARLGDRAWRELLEAHDSASRVIVERHDGEVVKTTGDGLLGMFADPLAALKAAFELGKTVDSFDLSSRAGLHAGQVELRDDGDIAGIAVNIAARVQALAAPGEVLVSQTMRELLLGVGTAFDDRGAHELKGIEGNWHLYRALHSGSD